MNRILKFFGYEHLQGELRKTSLKFSDLAYWIERNVADGPEKTVALRKLLEAKDAAVRAKLHPGG